MELVLVGQLYPPLCGRVFHPVHRQLESLAEHGGGQVEVPGGHHRGHPVADQAGESRVHGAVEGVVQGEDARQLPVNGTEYGVFHMKPRRQGNLHQPHEVGGAHQYLFVADDAGQAALITEEVGYPAVNGPLGPEQVVEGFVQAAARFPDEGGGIGYHLFRREVAEDLDAVEGDTARGEQVGVGDQDAAAAGGGDAVPAGDGGPRFAQPLAQGKPGLPEAQGPRQGGGGGEGGGQAPQQPLRRAPANGGHDAQQHTGDKQQGADPPENTLGAVAGLHLPAKAYRIARPLGVGVPAVPLALIQGDQIGVGGGCRRLTGQPQAPALSVGAPQQQGNAQHNGGTVGHLALPGVQLEHGKRVGQGGGGGKEQQGVHAELQPQQAEQTPEEDIQPQQHGQHLDPGQGQHPQLRRKGLGMGKDLQGQIEGGQEQQEDQGGPQPHPLETLAVPFGQIRRGQIGGGRGLLPRLALPAAGGGLLLLVGAGNKLLRPAYRRVVLHALLFKHMLGVVIRLFQQAVDALSQGAFLRPGGLLRKVQHIVLRRWGFGGLPGWGFLLGRGGLLHRRLPGGGGLGRLLSLLLTAVGEGEHPPRLFGGGGGSLAFGYYREGYGILLIRLFLFLPAAEFRQNGFQGELVPAGQILIQFVIPVFCHGNVLLFLKISGCQPSRCRTASYSKMAAAALALRELSLPFMGIRTRKSQVSDTRRPMPSPSLPMTMAAGPFRSAS